MPADLVLNQISIWQESRMLPNLRANDGRKSFMTTTENQIDLDLMPLPQKTAQGREIAGLSACEEGR